MTAIRDGLAAGVWRQITYRDTVMDEDRLPHYELMAARFELPGDSNISGTEFNRSAFPLESLACGKDLRKRQRFPVRALAWIFPALWKFPE